MSGFCFFAGIQIIDCWRPTAAYARFCTATTLPIYLFYHLIKNPPTATVGGYFYNPSNSFAFSSAIMVLPSFMVPSIHML